MSDLTRRLREGYCNGIDCEENRVAAAAKIEELEAKVQVLEEIRQAHVDELLEFKTENERLTAGLEEIRDVARCSDGVEFYEMLADQALEDSK